MGLNYTYPLPEEIVSITPERERIAGKVCPLCGMVGDENASATLNACRQRYTYVDISLTDVKPIRLCRHCNVLLSFPWDSEEEYAAWYCGTEYATDEQAANGQAPMMARDWEYHYAARERVEAIQRHGVSSGRFLDIGAGTGAFVQEANNGAIIARGIEPCAALTEYARQHGRRVDVGDWTVLNDRMEYLSFDVITLFDVLEHLTRPLDCMKTLAAHLNPNGLIVIEMPEWDSPDQRKAGLYWRHIRPRQHVCLYSRKAAEELFNRAGLEVEAFCRPLRGALGKACWYLGRQGDIP